MPFPHSTRPRTHSPWSSRGSFKKFQRGGIAVATQGFYTVDVALEVGELTQSVQVSGDAPLMETVIPSAAGGLVARQLEALPNTGRNVYTIAGGASYSNNFLLDGVPVTETNNRTIIIPSIEAVQEVKLQANTYDAEMGRTGGGVFNTYLKSGTNQIHGSLFGYHRDPEWAGNDFFRNRAGIARPNQSWKNSGASFGGPAVLPKIYNGKNKTFFWLAQEAYRQKEAFAADFAVPTLEQRRGDFSQSRTRDGALQTIYDPLTTRTECATVVRSPFPGNVLPGDRINRIGSPRSTTIPRRAAPPRSTPRRTTRPRRWWTIAAISTR